MSHNAPVALSVSVNIKAKPTGFSFDSITNIFIGITVIHWPPRFTMSDFKCPYCSYTRDKQLCGAADPNICEPCKRLEEVEDQIKRTLDHLAKERQRLKEEVNYTHNRIIHRLPIELAAHIFDLCLLSPQDSINLDLSKFRSSSYTVSAPSILSSVCRRWRFVALSTPCLWNTLLLCVRRKSSPPLDFIETSIKRAGTLPLVINLYISLKLAVNRPGFQVVNILNRYSDRWQHLKYTGPALQLWNLSRDRSELPQLRTLYINSLTSDHWIRDKGTLKLNPKRLINLIVVSTLSLRVFDFDWQYLRVIQLASTSVAECLEALHKASSLTRCMFRAIQHPDQPDQLPLSQNPILRPQIHSLEILDGVLYAGILRELLCPALKTLVLEFGWNSEVDMPLILKFLKTSGCSLESLSLFYAKLAVPDVDSLCAALPTLQHLHIYHHHSIPAVRALFARLAEFESVGGRTTPRYLPTLRSLTVDEHREQDDWSHWNLIPNIFGPPTAPDSRLIERHRCSLESVTINIRYGWELPKYDFSTNPMTQSTLDKISRLEQEGVKCSFRRTQQGEDKGYVRIAPGDGSESDRESDESSTR